MRLGSFLSSSVLVLVHVKFLAENTLLNDKPTQFKVQSLPRTRHSTHYHWKTTSKTRPMGSKLRFWISKLISSENVFMLNFLTCLQFFEFFFQKNCTWNYKETLERHYEPTLIFLRYLYVILEDFEGFSKKGPVERILDGAGLPRIPLLSKKRYFFNKLY